jgi:hypothetical protein
MMFGPAAGRARGPLFDGIFGKASPAPGFKISAKASARGLTLTRSVPALGYASLGVLSVSYQ